ncbi:hypothetical protein A4X13_0g7543 [Tilletia indica]|uniref:Uncharacterized protein n=1 Tax=Tilletia indica TaxID=43049 RepID=A0A177TL05_9BASI|nr:hypothetical protein A4X13_0g7543 [Tilletia indica]
MSSPQLSKLDSVTLKLTMVQVQLAHGIAPARTAWAKDNWERHPDPAFFAWLAGNLCVKEQDLRKAVDQATLDTELVMNHKRMRVACANSINRIATTFVPCHLHVT